MKTVLITAAGSASAATVLKCFHAQGLRVVATDIYPREWNIACMEADAFFQAVPASRADAYVAQLKEAVQREQADFLIPLTDVEVDVLCGQKAAFTALGCTVCVPDESAARLCRDKMAMAEALSKDDLCQTIPTVSPYGWQPEEAAFPLMLKPLSGRSSQGQVVAHTREDFDTALRTRNDYIAQPFILGDIYTVDVARDRFGGVQALARQELLRTVNGLGTTVRVFAEHPLEGICQSIARRAGVVGVVNMEFIHHDGLYYFLEVNPRFSGGLGFSAAAGVDFATLSLLCHEGASIGVRGAVKAGVFIRRVEAVCTQM